MKIWVNVKKCINEGLNCVRALLLWFIKFVFEVLTEIFVGLRHVVEELIAILKDIVRPIISDNFKIFIERILVYGVILYGGFVVLTKLQ